MASRHVFVEAWIQQALGQLIHDSGPRLQAGVFPDSCWGPPALRESGIRVCLAKGRTPNSAITASRTPSAGVHAAAALLLCVRRLFRAPVLRGAACRTSPGEFSLLVAHCRCPCTQHLQAPVSHIRTMPNGHDTPGPRIEWPTLLEARRLARELHFLSLDIVREYVNGNLEHAPEQLIEAAIYSMTLAVGDLCKASPASERRLARMKKRRRKLHGRMWRGAWGWYRRRVPR